MLAKTFSTTYPWEKKKKTLFSLKMKDNRQRNRKNAEALKVFSEEMSLQEIFRGWKVCLYLAKGQMCSFFPMFHLSAKAYKTVLGTCV